MKYVLLAALVIYIASVILLALKPDYPIVIHDTKTKTIIQRLPNSTTTYETK